MFQLQLSLWILSSFFWVVLLIIVEFVGVKLLIWKNVPFHFLRDVKISEFLSTDGRGGLSRVSVGQLARLYLLGLLL